MQIERRQRSERRSIDLRDVASAGPANLLGLEPIGIAGVGGAAEQRSLLAASMPFAALALVALLVVVTVCAVESVPLASLGLAVLPALAAPLALLAVWGWQREAEHRKMRQPWVIRGSVLLAAVAGTGWGALAGAPPPMAAAAALAFAGGAVVMLLALAPLAAAAAAAALALGVGAALARPDWAAPFEAVISAAAAALILARMMRVRLGTAAHTTKSEALARKAGALLADFESSGKGWFWETDESGRLTYVSPQLARQLDREADALLGTPLTDLFADESATGERSPRGERTVGFHLSARLAFGDAEVRAAGLEPPRWWSVSGRPAHDEDGRFAGFRGSGTDLTEMRRSEAEVTRLARFDALTNLPNRVQMRQTLETAMRESAQTGRSCALMLLDLDRFKSVNDTLGHPVGDALLRQVAERLMSVVDERGRVGRLGGDEFKVVIPDAHDRIEIAGLADRIIERLSAPYMIDGSNVSIGASVGVAVAPADGDCPDALVRNADLALYAAKADGKGRHRFYQEAMHATARDRRLLEIDLRNALADGTGLHLQFQPIVRCEGEVIAGFEALARWTHPTRGEVSPALFIPLAEEIGLIPQIGAWVIRNACREAARWPDQVRVAVNISPIQFTHPALPAIIMNALADSQIAPNRLELEITEGVFMHDSAATDAMFARLAAIGVRFALDDFGTGYSSLGYLKRAPFNKIKIDQSFVRGIAIKGNRNAAIVKAIVTLADSLGMETTAEGAETHDELDFLRSLGCSHVQGFIFGRPMAADEASARVMGDARLSADGFAAARPPRIAVLRSALLYYGDQRQTVRVRNISEGGAMAETERDVPCGCAVELAFPNGERIRGEVRWSQAGRFGIQFEEAYQISKLPGAARTIAADPRYAA